MKILDVAALNSKAGRNEADRAKVVRAMRESGIGSQKEQCLISDGCALSAGRAAELIRKLDEWRPFPCPLYRAAVEDSLQNSPSYFNDFGQRVG